MSGVPAIEFAPNPQSLLDLVNIRKIAGEAGAHFNAERTHRFALWRRVSENDNLPWNSGKDFVLFVGLNPSIANETILDPTVTRCKNYARRWGFHYLFMGNLYSKISTDPTKVDFDVLDKVDELENYWELAQMCAISDQVVIAWGSNANQDIAQKWLKLEMVDCKRILYCLGKNKNGSPKHPLYLKADLEPEVFTVP